MSTQHNFGPVGIIAPSTAELPDARLLPLGNYFVSESDGKTYFVVRGVGGVHTWKLVSGGGGAPLSNLAPLPVGTTSPGTGVEASRNDHVHAHGNQPGGSLHDLVIADPGGVAGFMSGLQAAQLAALVAALTPPPLFLYVPGVVLGDLVTIVSPDTVGKADATLTATMPAIGFVTSFPDATHLTIVMVGSLSGFVGLVPGTSYYVDNAVPGGVTSNVGNGYLGAPFVTGNVIQKIGVAINPTTMLVAMGSEDTLGV